jgi:nicotinate-nucleotide--dimethylbenzimidazole phosphoribosyltransferase
MKDALTTEEWLGIPVAEPDIAAKHAAQKQQKQLTKPPGSLGQLEQIAIRLAALQGNEKPTAECVSITVFAGDHGVAAEGVSAFPQIVTSEMIKNFAQGGAAISVLAKAIKAPLNVVNMGTAYASECVDGVTSLNLGPGTANFVNQPAMTESQLEQSLNAGYEAVERAQIAKIEIFIGGEMGIANTTSATALACALLNRSPTQLTGAGTGLDASGIAHKLTVIQRALDHHHAHLNTPTEILRRLGGFEIAALTGAYIRCAQAGLPVIVDGYIASVAALLAERLKPGTKQWLLFSHLSTEPGHRHVLDALEEKPFLDLNLRLGEGSGAAILVPLLRLACRLHNEMATFSQAQISTQ